jgi:CRISPR-associated protein Csb1
MTSQFDSWLASDGPVALTITESLDPASGEQSVIFPPTFAPPEENDKEKPNYVIDENRTCLVDSLGSQANRLEPMFKRPDLAELTPRFTVKINEQRTLDLLDAGHRAADAVVRFSDKWKALHTAFVQYRDSGNAQALAKIAPTSLVFGAWDSRDTGAKLPRLIESTIRAYGVERLTRSAQYFSALEKDEIEGAGLDELGQKTLSTHGLLDSPSGRAPGGVVAKEGIKREALLNLVALRALGASDVESTPKLQRYILGLALVAFVAPTQLYLRQGCLLVASEGKPASKQVVWRTGKRDALALTDEQVLAFAKSAATEFGVGAATDAVFDAKLVKSAADAKSKKKTKAPKAQ